MVMIARIWQKFFRALTPPPELKVFWCVKTQQESLFRREYFRRIRWWHWWTEPYPKWIVKNDLYQFLVGAWTKRSAIRKTVQLFHDLNIPLKEEIPRLRLSADIWKPNKATLWQARLGHHSIIIPAKSYEEAHEKAESFFLTIDSDLGPAVPLEVWRFELRENLEARHP